MNSVFLTCGNRTNYRSENQYKIETHLYHSFFSSIEELCDRLLTSDTYRPDPALRSLCIGFEGIKIRLMYYLQ